MDVLGIGGELIEVPENIFEDAGGTLNKGIDSIMEPLNNLSKSIGGLLQSINPNMILIAVGAIGLFMVLKK